MNRTRNIILCIVLAIFMFGALNFIIEGFTGLSANNEVSLFLIKLGLLVFLLIIIWLVVTVIKNNKRKKLVASGKKIIADIIKIVPHSTSGSTTTSSHSIICEWADEQTGTHYVFKSARFHIPLHFFVNMAKTALGSDSLLSFNPASATKDTMMDALDCLGSVPVYVDVNNYKNYYVDTDAFINKPK